MAEPGGGKVSVKVTADTDDAVAGLKRLERQARRTARALAELREVVTDETMLRALAARGIQVQFVPSASAEPKEA